VTAASPDPAAPDTIVLIHGLWMTPRSWEQWIPYYQSRGYRVLAPTYPGFEVEVEALRADPSPIETLTVPETVFRRPGAGSGPTACWPTSPRVARRPG
jgi:hypothetical protein